jgi:hypothetical protein
MRPLRPSPQLAARILTWIDELRADSRGEWPIRVCKEELNALPLHGNLIYLWAIRADGTLLCMDHEAFAHPTEPETDPLTRYAVLLHGARKYSELQELIPPPPEGARPCGICGGTGLQEQEAAGQLYETSCGGCSGLGWVSAPTPR